MTERQETALLMLSRGAATSYNRKSFPSLVRRGLVRDCGQHRLVRWELTEAGEKAAAEVQRKWSAKL